MGSDVRSQRYKMFGRKVDLILSFFRVHVAPMKQVKRSNIVLNIH